MSEENKYSVGMAARLRLSKCCCCLSLDQGARLLGGVLLLFTLGKSCSFCAFIHCSLCQVCT